MTLGDPFSPNPERRKEVKNHITKSPIVKKVVPRAEFFKGHPVHGELLKLGQNHDAQRYRAPPPRIGQPLMVAWPALSVWNASTRSCSSSAFSTSSCTERTTEKGEVARLAN